MIRRTTGPATWLPNPACSTIAITTYCGLFAGAYEANQLKGCLPTISAEPVFAAIGIVLNGHPRYGYTAVPFTGTCDSARWTYFTAETGAPTRARTAVPIVFTALPAGVAICIARCGTSTLPPFATAAYTTAICSGVASTSPWPIAMLSASPPRQRYPRWHRSSYRSECVLLY